MHHFRQQILDFCRQKKINVTTLRARVLDLILAETSVIKAYSILQKMQELYGRVNPPTVYRSLDFWQSVGLLHKVDAVSGFILCHDYMNHPHERPFVLICRNCGKIMEHDFLELSHLLDKVCTTNQFTPDQEPIVVTGICCDCKPCLHPKGNQHDD